MPETNEKFVQGLRDLADFLQANPDVDISSNHEILICLNHRPDPKAAIAEAARRFAPVSKVYRDPWFHIAKTFGPIELQWFVGRDKVCRQVVTGTKTVTLPAEEAKPERVVEVQETKWICDEPLLAPPTAAEFEAAQADDLSGRMTDFDACP